LYEATVPATPEPLTALNLIYPVAVNDTAPEYVVFGVQVFAVSVQYW